jgi:hypothetical protein
MIYVCLQVDYVNDDDFVVSLATFCGGGGWLNDSGDGERWWRRLRVMWVAQCGGGTPPSPGAAD